MTKGWTVVGAIVLVGCARDTETLDRFSHAYTDFIEHVHTTEISAGTVASDVDPFGFYAEIAAAVNVNSSNESRLGHAATAIGLGNSPMAKAMDGYGDEIEELDGAVLKLVKTANAIHNAEYRASAVATAKYAREVQYAFVVMHALSEKRLDLQRKVMNDILNDGGALKVTATFRECGTEAKKIFDELESTGKKQNESFQKMKDTFSALEGRANLVSYPTKEEIKEKSGKK